MRYMKIKSIRDLEASFYLFVFCACLHCQENKTAAATSLVEVQKVQ